MQHKEPHSDPAEFAESDGPKLTKAARQAIEDYLSTRKILIPSELLEDHRLDHKRGCFVTLKENDSEKTLRGCIGFAEPIYRLSYALTHAAIAAATEDPRFPAVRDLAELDQLLTEVSILSLPFLIKVGTQKELPNKIVVGEDGLIMRWSYGSGLLLPQVATEYRWDAEEFLCNLSMKAGAPPDQWLVPGTLVYKFNAQVFAETLPKGEVVLLPQNSRKQ